MGDGRVPQPSVDGLSAMGKWMAVNGDAINKSTTSLVDSPACRTTTQGRYINVFVERWRPGELVLPGSTRRRDARGCSPTRASPSVRRRAMTGSCSRSPSVLPMRSAPSCAWTSGGT
ncbi:MAG: hypothetical protein IPF47_02380 [Gemmatimonadetes bacterium]|nr:hypothetical protein [Gemmatimonadota bacterium]